MTMFNVLFLSLFHFLVLFISFFCFLLLFSPPITSTIQIKNSDAISILNWSLYIQQGRDKLSESSNEIYSMTLMLISTSWFFSSVRFYANSLRCKSFLFPLFALFDCLLSIHTQSLSLLVRLLASKYYSYRYVMHDFRALFNAFFQCISWQIGRWCFVFSFFFFFGGFQWYGATVEWAYQWKKSLISFLSSINSKTIQLDKASHRRNHLEYTTDGERETWQKRKKERERRKLVLLIDGWIWS